MKKLTSITPFLFEGFLIISLHLDWINKFGKIPSFIVQIDDDGRLHLISDEVIK